MADAKRKWRWPLAPLVVIVGLGFVVAAEQGPGADLVPFAGGDAVATKSTTTTTTTKSVVYGADTTDADLSAAPGEMRMTGGGTIAGTTGKISRGFIIRCDLTSKLPNRLEVNWDKGNNFHLEQLTYAKCTDDPSIVPYPPDAGFDTFDGVGNGKLNGVNGAKIYFRFTDAGEPGTSDTASLLIKNPAGTTVLTEGGTITGGNNQAHK
jgi:hypothetical protein